MRNTCFIIPVGRDDRARLCDALEVPHCVVLVDRGVVADEVPVQLRRGHAEQTAQPVRGIVTFLSSPVLIEDEMRRNQEGTREQTGSAQSKPPPNHLVRSASASTLEHPRL
jgi:hypothetical protein